jgi:mono/diheme cytochrome c family protein
MRRDSRVAVLAVAVVALSAAAVPAVMGGWAVLTVHEVPASLTVGQPTTLTFSLRQHGEELMSGRAPVVKVRSGGVLLGERQEIAAERTRERGVYRATFTPTEPGDLRIVVDADYHGYEAPLLPMAVVARGATMPTQSAEVRGRALFVAKGCVGCHTKSDDAALNDFREMRVGPELGGRTYPQAWLVQKITDPAALRPAGRPNAQSSLMPKLEVTIAEAQAIASYINFRTVATRD